TYRETPQQVLFHSAYAGQVSSNRRVGSSRKKSTHSTGQALDLYAISVFLSGGTQKRIPFHRNHVTGSDRVQKSNHQFYWSFANCWRKRIRDHSTCNCVENLAGALTYLDNNAHRDHIHISLPHCERSRFNVACV
ncbi:MAG: hypothetical protein AAF202_09125, partial [Pseudomonadota bacterium]